MDLEQIKSEVRVGFEDLLQRAALRPGQVVVIGCSTSEVIGGKIGKCGSPEVAEALYEPLHDLAVKYGVFLAFQCCEHLNRALVVEGTLADQKNLTVVSAVPHPHAGGSMASYAYRTMSRPVLVEQIQADAGLDIGETMIGMHLKPVAVPQRLAQRQVGAARLSGATTRPKLIGGERAKYAL